MLGKMTTEVERMASAIVSEVAFFCNGGHSKIIHSTQKSSAELTLGKPEVFSASENYFLIKKNMIC